MASDFQPDDPHPTTDGPAGVSKSAIMVMAILSGLMVIMILAIWAPRVLGDSRWIVTLGAGALVAAVVAGFGFARRSRGG